MDHDRLFKELLTAFFADFLDLFLPKMVAYLDRTAIEFLDKEVFCFSSSNPLPCLTEQKEPKLWH